MAAKPIPEGYNTLSIYLAVDDARQAIDILRELDRLEGRRP